ncbi:hypothetical protein ACFYYH_26320 [Streptomyces sp. NPDC002018]|uniref:hypothetical protein n=1 Tax=Streptomyces sp. NPDC002018 TaxID=3364629 RepID=UPI0036A18E4C
MTATHSPLSNWVVDAIPTADALTPDTMGDNTMGDDGMGHDTMGDNAMGAGTTGDTPTPDGPRWRADGWINDGDERADARRMPRFADGWQRRSLTTEDGTPALGLVHPASGTAVLELTESGEPVPATEETAAAVSALEERWPPAQLTRYESSVLAEADPALRYSLLTRLVSEGDPRPDSFHILPWERVENLVDEVTATLRRGPDALPAVSPAIRLRHHFAPAGSRFTASLEQLDAGLRAADPVVARVGATRLCSRLATLRTDRLPDTTRLRLSGLLLALPTVHPFLRGAARIAAARLGIPLSGEGRFDDRSLIDEFFRDGGFTSGPPAMLPTDLAPAAGSDDEARQAEARVVREPFTIRLAVTSTGRAEIEVEAPLTETAAESVATSYGVLLLPVRVLGVVGGTDFYVLMEADEDLLLGELDLPVGRGRFVSVDQSGPPVGRAELAFLGVAEVRATMRALPTRSDRERWLDLVGTLPAGHPVRTAVEEETQR